MKKKLVLLVTSLMLVLSGCGNSASMSAIKNSSDAIAPANYMERADFSEEEIENNVNLADSMDGVEYADKLIYTCELSIETLDYDASLEKIKNAVKEQKGFLQSESSYTNSYGDSEVKHCELIIRIPSVNYDLFLNGLSEAGSVNNMHAYVDNITQEYYDTETRIKALRVQEERLLEMLGNCETVTDMIEVEGRLTEVQSDLAAYQTRLNIMQKDVDYSTFTVNIEEVRKITTASDTAWDRFLDRVENSWDFFVDFMSGLLTVIIYLFPFLIVILILWLIFRPLRKKMKAKKLEKVNNQQVKQESKKENESEK